MNRSVMHGMWHDENNLMSLVGISGGARLLEGSITQGAVSPVSGGTAVLADGKAVDAEESGDAVNNEDCPVHVDNKGEDKVDAEVKKLQPGSNHWEAQDGEVDKHRTTDKWGLQDSPVRERLSQEVVQDDHGGHTSKHKSDDPAEQDQVVVGQNGRVRR